MGTSVPSRGQIVRCERYRLTGDMGDNGDIVPLVRFGTGVKGVACVVVVV